MTRAALIVLAKAPEPGKVKTRLCPPLTPEEAADLAAAALLDTLAAATAVPGSDVVVAMSGALGSAARRADLAVALAPLHVVGQHGDTLGARIVAAHSDTAICRPGRPTLQIGMDTPQACPDLLADGLDRLLRPGVDAVLGPAADGGWWALGLRDPRAAVLIADVPTSRDDTGDRTMAALRRGGLRVAALPSLVDVDTADDAVAVAATVPASRFAAAVAQVAALGVRVG